MIAAFRIVLFFLFFSILFTSYQVRAEEYRPGTIGYLYKNCHEAIQKNTVAEFHQTYCGKFYEGLYPTLLWANWIILGNPEPGPCQEKLRAEHSKIHEKLCEKGNEIFDSRGSSLQINFMVRMLSWIDWLGQNKKFVFERKVDNLFDLMMEHRDCDASLEERLKFNFDRINPSLLKSLDWKNYTEKPIITLEQTYDLCRKDIDQSHSDPRAFIGTLCGAEILGGLTGLKSTQSLQRRKNIEGECSLIIDDLYKSINVMKKACVDDNTDPIILGRAFLKMYENEVNGVGIFNKNDLLEENEDFSEKVKSISGYGAAGYFPTYYGGMCKIGKSLKLESQKQNQ